MMKLLICTLLIGLFASCSNNNKLNDAEVIVNLDEADTFHVGSFVFNPDSAEENEFTSLIHFSNPDTSERNNLVQTGTGVQRHGDSLILQLDNGKINSLVNNYTDDADSFAVYSYLGPLGKTDEWLVYGTFYEWYNYILINKHTGTETILWGIPQVSPEGNYIIAGNQDMVAGFTYNGFQLFSVTDSKVKFLGSRELRDWGPDQVRWKDNNTIVVKKTELDTLAGEKSGYLKIKIFPK